MLNTTVELNTKHEFVASMITVKRDTVKRSLP